jgi:hypothetical protein
MSEPRYKNGYMIALDQIVQLTAALATERARADALAVEVAAFRAALIQSTLTQMDDLILPTCPVCGRVGEHRDEIIHKPFCVFARRSADPAQRGAELLAAADALAAPFPSVSGQRLAACRICRATWPIGQPERHQDIEYGVPCPVVAYHRLRGGRAPEDRPA